MTIKYYRKIGTKKTTHKSCYSGGYYRFWQDKPNGLFESFRLEFEFNQFLKDNQYEEVIEEQNKFPKKYLDKNTGTTFKANLEEVIEKAEDKVRLPEVRKRYKLKGEPETQVLIKEIVIDEFNTWIGRKGYDGITLKDFWELYEELPEDNIEKKACPKCKKTFNEDDIEPYCQRWDCGIAEDIKEKPKNKCFICDTIVWHNYLEYISPLDAKAERYYCSKECYKIYDKPKSIWKDVSELPEKECQVLVKTCNGIMIGSFRRYIDEEQLQLVVENIGMCGGNIPIESLAISHYGANKYATLTDFINNTEERLRKLEGK